MDAITPKPAQRLEELSRIVQAVDRAADLEGALQVAVQRTRSVMNADVCSIYFSDDAQRRHVVATTDGLASRYVGTLAVDFGSGVIGRVAQEQRPINLDHIPETLDQSFLEQTGLKPHAGFLGVPILHKARVQGVLLVRQRHPRRFDFADEALLSTLASRLGGSIAYAKASGELCAACRPGRVEFRCLAGRAGAPGVVLGTGAWVFSATELQDIPTRITDDPAQEEARFLDVLNRVRDKAKSMADSLQGRIADADRALFDAFAMILESPELRESVTALIRDGQWAPGAVRSAIESHAGHFDAMDDPYLRQRATDIRALARQVDFLSVGTNDLAQYLLATDRNNPRVSARLDPLHPSMLEALNLIVRSAKRTGKPVSVCGEMASDPVMAMMLLGMGFDGLSLSPTALLEVKWAIRRVSFRYMQFLARQALSADDAEGIQRLVKEAFARTGLADTASAGAT